MNKILNCTVNDSLSTELLKQINVVETSSKANLKGNWRHQENITEAVSTIWQKNFES